MTDQLVTMSVDNGIATVTLDSVANRNALSTRLLTQLSWALTSAGADEAVHAIVLTAQGSVFCSGADLADPPSNDPDKPFSYPEVLRAIIESPKPVVARINGHARAGGLGLIAACDIALAPSAATFAFTEVRIGVVPAIIAVVCQRVMQPRPFERYVLTGETFDAAAAAACGLVTVAVPDADLDATVASVLADLHRTEPTAVAITKGLVAALPEMDLSDAFAHAAAISVERFASAEGREGIAAFREKRSPSWAW